jgi:hypothetical protein
MVLKSLSRKTVILIFIFIISFGTPSLLIANGIEKTKSVGLEYFPFDPNTKLTYETTFGDAISLIKLDGDVYVQELKSDDFIMNQRLNIIDNKYCVIDLQQEIDVFLFITHSVDVSYSEPARLVGLPLIENEKWEWTGIEYINDKVDTLFITTEYAGDEMLTTEAGEFNCKKLNYVIKKSSGKVTKYYEWRTPGIGLVKFEADLDPKGFIGTLQGLLGYDEIYFTLKKVESIDTPQLVN